MQFQISTAKDHVTVFADVGKIEVEDIISPSEDDIDATHYRTIRFVTSAGESIEVFCNTLDEQALTLQSVKPRKAVNKIKKGGWLEPKLYKPEKK
jgi:hypothetical protein